MDVHDVAGYDTIVLDEVKKSCIPLHDRKYYILKEPFFPYRNVVGKDANSSSVLAAATAHYSVG
jgi:hypothetical protein